MRSIFNPKIVTDVSTKQGTSPENRGVFSKITPNVRETQTNFDIYVVDTTEVARFWGMSLV